MAQAVLTWVAGFVPKWFTQSSIQALAMLDVQ